MSVLLSIDAPPPPRRLGRSTGDDGEVLGSTWQGRGPEVKGGLITSLQPLRIHSSPSHPPRAPTLQECEVIIRQLYNANSLQSQEVSAHYQTILDIILLLLSISLMFFHAFTKTLCHLDCKCEVTAERYCFEQENHPRKLHSDQDLSC